MAFEPNERYQASVKSACLTESVNKGTPGIAITFEVEGVGTIDHTIWLTPKTVERAEKDLCTLGAKAEDLKSWSYLENIGYVISGHECDITTFEEEYNGKRRVKVQWINERRKASAPGANLAGRVAVMFGEKEPPKAQQPAAPPIDDEDVPF